MASDIKADNHGSLWLLAGLTAVGVQWISENVGDDETLTFGGAVVVEPRYIVPIVDGARAEGLEVEVS